MDYIYNPPTPLAAGGARQRRNYQQQGPRSHYKQQGQEARNKKQEARSNYKQQAARSKKQEARKQQVEEENEEDEEEEEMKAAIWTGASFLPAARRKKQLQVARGRTRADGRKKQGLKLVSRQFRKRRLAVWAAGRGPDPSFTAMVFEACDRVLGPELTAGKSKV